MKDTESQHKSVVTAHAERVNAAEMLGVRPREKQNGDVSKQDLRQELQESRESEARLRKIIDTIPTLAWCNLSDGSNEFVNQRWSDYTESLWCSPIIDTKQTPKTSLIHFSSRDRWQLDSTNSPSALRGE